MVSKLLLLLTFIWREFEKCSKSAKNKWFLLILFVIRGGFTVIYEHIFATRLYFYLFSMTKLFIWISRSGYTQRTFQKCCKLLYVGPVSIWMGDCLRSGTPSR